MFLFFIAKSYFNFMTESFYVLLAEIKKISATLQLTRSDDPLRDVKLRCNHFGMNDLLY